ncbi:MAG TPA: hypothetical protein VM165_25230 [Planctomycetaceae bacterium]|nr:hypothetical protein [Planctomycetaceae bacterium]
MPGSYQDILRPQVLTEVVRQVVASADPILNFMGFQPGGSNEKHYGHGREGDYHIFDDSRRVAKARAPGTPAGRSSKQAMKAVHFTYPRMHDSISLLGEYTHNLGMISDPRTRDVAGKDMITRQTSVLMRRAANFRIAMTVGMLRDSLYIQQEGDDWFINYTSTNALFQKNFRVPSGNKTTLTMTDRAGTAVHSGAIIDVPWSSPGADIVLHFAKINAARAAQGVGPVKHVHCNSIVARYLMNNDGLAVIAGISNPPFTKYERDMGTRPDGTPLHEYTLQFLALPGVTFHVTDEGLELWDAATDAHVWTKHFSDTMAVMMGEPTAEKYTMYTGSEPIAEYDGGPETVRVGLSSWSKKTSNPTSTEIYVLDNCLSVPHDPYDLIVATVA